MRHFIILLLILGLYGCESNPTTAYNFKDGVIIEKYQRENCYNVLIRYKSMGHYTTSQVKISKYEYDQFKLGDTIK